MFSFFSRKQQQQQQQQQPPATPKQSDAMDVDSVPQQLRTPSPSEAASNGLGPAAHIASPSQETETTTLDPPKPALPPPTPTPTPTPEALHALVSTIPAKTLHAYVLAHLPTAPADTLASLAAFFATLTPPPRLHCVRCHADYTEIENDDRKCHVPHDDESAYVERVGIGRGGSEYETQYGCCGKTVEGEGDLGPPDGWCYEGMHTTDVKRARFRADSSPANDMLVSCFRLNCHNIRARLPGPGLGTSARRAKRARPPPGDMADNDDDDDDDDGNASRYTEDSGIAEIARGVGAMGGKGKGRARTKTAVAVKPESRAAAATTATTTAETPARRRVRVKAPRARESDAESSKAGSVAAPPPPPPPASTSAPAPAPAAGTPGPASSPVPAAVAPRKRRPATKPRRTVSPTRRPVSTAKAPSTPAPVAAASPAASPPDSSPAAPRGRKPRSPSKMDSVEIIVRSRSATRSRVRGSGAETADEKMMTDAEGKVRKRRKLAGGTGAGAGAA